MITDAPDPLEVTNFRFRQMRRLCMSPDDEKVLPEAINLVATSNRFGLVFVGIEGGFKVLKLENIFDLNEDEEKRKEAKDFPYQMISSPTPSLLTLSADEMTLAVCITRDVCSYADMYDIRAFADQEETPFPFTTVRLSSDNNVRLQDFMWNPVVVEMYTFCLSDGSVHVHELVDTNLKIAANLPPQTCATAVCWSPKGKEIVVGKKNGSFSRFKPTLQEVKNFPPPTGLDENGVEVVSIFWISTTLFAVVYVPAGNSDDKSPSLVFVSTPKGANMTYTNFGDVCYGSSCDKAPRYMMHYDPEWKILICASSNAVESAVIGCSSGDQLVWQQWILDDSCRAEVPLVGNTESPPLGVGVIYCAQRKIVISDTEIFPPMPVLFLLSSSASLCPFHMLNIIPGAANVVYPSEPICREGERQSKSKGILTQQRTVEPPKSSAGTTLAPSGNLLKIVQPRSESFLSGDKNSNPLPSASSISFNSSPLTSVQTSTISGSVLDKVQSFITPQASTFSVLSHQKNLPTPEAGSSPMFEISKPSAENFSTLKPFSANLGSAVSTVPPQSSLSQVSSSTSFCGDQSAKRSLITTVQPSVHISAVKNSHLSSSILSTDQKATQERLKAPNSVWINESTIVSAILEEIAEFNRELQDLKARTSSSEVFIGTKDEMSYLKKSSMSLTEFHKKMKIAMETLGYEVHTLKNMTLETYAMLAEAKSREERLKDSKYVSMLQERSLDPLSAKRMLKIEQLNHYLSTQLKEINDKLDNDWHELIQKQKSNRRKVQDLPSTEALYRTIVSNQNIIYNQKTQLEHMFEVLNKRKKDGQRRGIKLYHSTKIEISDAELGKLADSLLHTKINNDEEAETMSTPRKTIPLKKQAALREILANRRVVTVRPTIIDSSAQSRLRSTLPETLQNAKDQELSPAISEHKNDMVTAVVNSDTVAQGKIPESFPSSPQQDATSVVPLITRPPTESKGLITQGTPVTKTLSKPTPNMIPVQALTSDVKSSGFKTLSNDSPEPSAFLAKDSSQSAFTHLVPMVSKPAPEPQKLPLQGNLGKSPFTSQNFFEQKTVPVASGFVTVSAQRAGQEQSFASPVVFSDEKLPSNVNPVTSSGIVHISTASELQNLGKGETVLRSSSYEDISPPNSPHISDDETDQPDAKDETNVQTSSQERETPGPPKVQLAYEEKAPIAQPGTFFFSPVGDRKAATTLTFLPKDVSHPQDREVSSSHPAAAVFQEVPSSGTATSVSISSNNYPAVVSSSSTNLQNQSSINFSVTATSTTTVPSNVLSSLMPTSQVTSTPATDSVRSSSTAVNPVSSSTNQTEDTVLVSETLCPTLSPTTTTVAVSSQSLQPNLVKVAPFTFTVPAKAESNEQEVKKIDTVTPVTVAPISSPPVSLTEPSDGDATTSLLHNPSQKDPAFGTISTSESSSTAFAQPTTVTSPLSPDNTPAAQPVFVQPAAGNGNSIFGQAVTTTSSVFGTKAVVTATAAISTATTTTTVPSTVSFFGQQPTTQASFFGKTFTSPAFGQSPQVQTSVFGQGVSSAETPSSASPFGQAGTGSFFNQSSSGGTSVFGQKPQSPPSSTPAFGQSSGAAGFSFQKASMEQQSPGSFGLAKSVFGQGPVFGQQQQQQQQQQNPSSPFGQSSSSGGIFGQGSFFSGLGGKPSEENASKNVFASAINSPTANSSIFGNQGATSFGSKLGGSFSGGSFSSGSGTVAQSGFGAFQQTPEKTTGFGGAASFGSSPTFGGSPNFGGSPTFGSGLSPTSPIANSAFGSSRTDGFGNFASTNAPTFGSLASQSPGFVNAAQQQQQQAPPAFGSLPPQSPSSTFGGGPVFGGSPGFGAQSGFGAPSTNQSSAFSQWRN